MSQPTQADETPPPNAGVTFPPPLVYAAAFLVGYLLHHAHPLPLAERGSEVARALRWLGFALGAGWLVLMGSAFATFARAHTTVIPNRPASTVVTSGPFRFTRNPMYLSLTLGYLAAVLLLDSWWPLMLLPVVVLVIDRAVIAREERYLSAAFPADYAAYRSRVRRWL